jgi:Ca2+-binding RTX toxin-like protein
MLTVSVHNDYGATDSVNFIYNVAGQGPNVTLTGTPGKDVLYGTGYNDTLTGGQSSDTFVFNQFGNASTPNADHVTDFNVFQDFLNVGGGHFANINALLAATQDVNGSAQITVDTNNTITLDHVTTAQLTAHQDHLLV